MLGDIVRSPHKQKPLSRAYTRAGVRATTYFDPSKVRAPAGILPRCLARRRDRSCAPLLTSPRFPATAASPSSAQVKAAVVTCGGLCPGLNNVIREVVDTLYYCYGVDTIVGVQNGYWGAYSRDGGGGTGRAYNEVERWFVLRSRRPVYACLAPVALPADPAGFHTPDADTAPVRSPNAPTHEPPLLTPGACHSRWIGGFVDERAACEASDVAPLSRSRFSPRPLPSRHFFLPRAASVAKVHNYGGTVLGSDRGGHDVDVILRFCENRGVNQVRGSREERGCRRRGVRVECT